MGRLIKLSELPPGASAVVSRLESGSAVLTRLRELGVLPGTAIRLVRRAPMGDPLEISIRGTLLSVRRHEAEMIELEVAE
jgi:Fe2+ transport system protein FeoA